MFYLIYVSAADHPMGEDELLEILETSRRNNPRHDITGMLLYKEMAGRREPGFMQLLEGPEAAVRALYRRIAEDPRHDTIVPLGQGALAARSFADWSMGFRTVGADDLKDVPGFADISDDSFRSPAFADLPAQKLLDLMKSFYDATG